ncbi:hypothetical protein ACFQZX_09345 [Mucilaginibacter litoreus]|uniref:Uncharacterized protein n=1 Tax=Mucilaginibacter litoreus TaxID=1048221 RepID=A0ABW3AS21_9SPHI
MAFLSSLFSPSLTPNQYCFPYFFDEEKFLKQIREFGLSYKLTINKKDNIFNPIYLYLFDYSNIGFEIDYFSNIMFDSLGNLLIWKTEEDLIRLTKIRLNNGLIEKVDFTINLADFQLGKNKLSFNYGLRNFVTFVRKKDLIYNLEYFETFVILIIDQININIIPFDWFNTTGGDYGYVWPAVAQINLKNFELTGKGMRMADFKVQLSDYI